MAASWPSTLPEASLRGMGVSPTDAVIRTDMDAGIVKMRRRYRNPPTTFSVEWVMTQAQYRIFTGWFESVIAFGADSFTIDLPDGAGTATEMTVRFAQIWKAKYLGTGNWSVSASLEVSNRTTTVYLATEAGDQLTTEGGDNLRLE